jgi:heat shock protein HslJ
MKLLLPLITGLCIATVLVAGCTMPTTTNQLSATSWKLAYYSDAQGGWFAAINGTNVTATFGLDGKLNGYAGCNQYSSQYSVNGNSISITVPGVTMMMCSPESVMQQEYTYLSRLPLASTWKITDGTTLTIFDASGKSLLSYTKTTFSLPK